MYTSINLNNGLRVINFSSPHPFNFVTGEVLPACKKKWVEKMSLDIVEVVKPWMSPVEMSLAKVWPTKYDSNIIDVELSVIIPSHVHGVFGRLEANGDVDVVLVPFMVLDALKSEGLFPNTYRKPRAIRVADRITKEIYSHKFCV